MSVVISLVMSFKFKVHMSLLIQSVMLPLNLMDNVCLKKHILGLFIKQHSNKLPYGELHRPPTAADVAALNSTADDQSSVNSFSPSVAKSAIPPNEPRVEELPDDSKTADKKSNKSTPAADLD
jgi:hypothetical protein